MAPSCINYFNVMFIVIQFRACITCPNLELESKLSEIMDTLRNNPKTTLFFGGDFNARGIDWETGLVPDGSPNRLVKEKLIEVIFPKQDFSRCKGNQPGARTYWIFSVVISPRLLKLVFPFLVFRITVLF